MPDVELLRAAKFWVALAGAVVTSVIASVPVAPTWLAVLSAVLTAVGVYLTPNVVSEGTTGVLSDDDLVGDDDVL